jgi:hypothetical protein
VARGPEEAEANPLEDQLQGIQAVSMWRPWQIAGNADGGAVTHCTSPIHFDEHPVCTGTTPWHFGFRLVNRVRG